MRDSSQPPLPWVGPGQKSESRGYPEGCWDPGSPGAETDLSVNVQLSLHTQDQEEKALKSRGRQKTKPEGLEVLTKALEGNLLSGDSGSSPGVRGSPGGGTTAHSSMQRMSRN